MPIHDFSIFKLMLFYSSSPEVLPLVEFVLEDGIRYALSSFCFNVLMLIFKSIMHLPIKQRLALKVSPFEVPLLW